VDPDHVPDRKAYEASRKDGRAEISVDTFANLVAEARELGLSRVKFTGGEPFLRKDLLDFCRVLHSMEIGFDIETNATLLTAKEARSLPQLSCFQVAVSLDGASPAFHDRFRGVPGAHRRAVRGIRRLLSAGLNVQVILALTADNEAEVEPTIALAAKLGVHSFKINPVTPGGRAKKMMEQGHGMDPARLVDMLPHCEKTLAQRYGIPVCFSLPLSFQDFEVIRNDRFGRCNILNIMGVLGDGSISICGIGKEEPALVMGRYPKVRIADVWRNGSVFVELRENLPRKLEGVCGRCILKGVCLGYCRANAYALEKNLMAPYWFCELAQKEGKLRESRLVPVEEG